MVGLLTHYFSSRFDRLNALKQNYRHFNVAVHVKNRNI